MTSLTTGYADDLEWTATDSPSFSDRPSMAVNPVTGFPAFATADREYAQTPPYRDTYTLKYVFYNGTAWVTKVIESAAQDKYGENLVTLLFGKRGRPIVMVRNPDSGIVKFFTSDSAEGGTWDTTDIEPIRTPDFPLVSLRPSGFPTLVYKDGDYFSYSVFDGDNWSTNRFPTEPVFGRMWFFTMALNKRGMPCLAYYRPADRDMAYCSFDGSKWTDKNTGIPISGPINRNPSDVVLAINPITDRASIAWSDDRALKYTTFDGTSWSPFQVVDRGPLDIISVRLAMSPITGQPTFVYESVRSAPSTLYAYDLTYAYLAKGNWTTSLVYRPYNWRLLYGVDAKGDPQILHGGKYYKLSHPLGGAEEVYVGTGTLLGTSKQGKDFVAIEVHGRKVTGHIYSHYYDTRLLLRGRAEASGRFHAAFSGGKDIEGRIRGRITPDRITGRGRMRSATLGNVRFKLDTRIVP